MSKLVIETEKINDEFRNTNIQIKDFTLKELSVVFGAILDDLINKNASNEEKKVIWKACALHDICEQFGFKSIASKLEEAFERLERDNDGNR